MELIIGASGYIGKNILDYFSETGKDSVGTYFTSPKKNLRYLDLKNPSLDTLDINFNKITHAIICSAKSKIKDCETNSDETYKINVLGTQNLINQLFEKNIIPIFLSSDRVFDGKKGNYAENDETSPYYHYGKHKKTIEDFLLNSNEKYLILRLSRVFGTDSGDGTLLTSLIKDLKEDKILKCADDQKFSLTYIGDLVKIVDKMLDENLYGLYNVASIDSSDRFELANLLKRELNISSGKIVPCSIREFGFSEPLPSDLTINNEKLKRDLNIDFPEIDRYLKFFK
ncbi:MAG: SDR family oxidoreductase [Candidatus Nanoarchaeia archaeon]|nr:SDR family oxidoreductase [Candidatus Nanoarchaeia archaeon]MDD5358121.1 SDR family oxidoreductase [Candidatus Nanoarchaeia archaeon]MDD5589308.1 SDR family oxidoreductase [Candidatus Nanoarchaeia archaeon]